MRIILAFLALFLTAPALAQQSKLLKPPTPSRPETSQPQQYQPPAEPQKATDNQRGTDQAPFIVQIQNPVKIEGNSDNGPKKSDDKSSAEWWGWTTDNWLAVLTAALVAVGILQLVVFGLQAYFLRRTIIKMDEIAIGQKADTVALVTATKSLADISKENTDLVRQLERPYVSGGGVRQIIQTVHKRTDDGTISSDHPPDAVISSDDPIYIASYVTGNFDIHINNHGRTTTHLYYIKWGFCDAENIPDVIQYEQERKWFDYIGPNTQSRFITSIPIRVCGNKTAIFGRFYHRDIWDNRRSDGFIYGIPGPALVPNDSIPVEAPRAYTQERKEPDDRVDE